MNTATGPQPQDFLIVEMGSRRYGLPASDVREIVRAVPPQPAPGATALVEGLINLRGTVIPVLDLRRLFRLPPKALEHTDHLVVACIEGRTAALRVDHAVDLVRLAAGQVDRLPDEAAYGLPVQRVAKLASGLVLIQDLQALLCGGELAAIHKAAQELPLPAAGGAVP